ncbi:hypothetical protein BDN71DRAFT_1514588 [Pleurotus eryngii]|uniref:Uncharacterized protein n=1 Tax=Pleurotus eryngii TaxID=5323 RepID=A0A9P5ZG42_PLEER|nr:hypothetical protein BDN71DRAFT_1514588 [Pleurotus eryngii]
MFDVLSTIIATAVQSPAPLILACSSHPPPSQTHEGSSHSDYLFICMRTIICNLLLTIM